MFQFTDASYFDQASGAGNAGLGAITVTAAFLTEMFGEALRATGQTLGKVASVFSLRLTVSTKTWTALKAPRV